MPRRDTHAGRSRPGAEPAARNTAGHDHGIIGRRRRRNAERRLARLLSPSNRRALAERLRRTANDPTRYHPALRALDVSVNDRAAAVRAQLLEIADLLEHARDPDPRSVEDIAQLLAREDSALYHPAIHISELYAALYYVRAGLITQSSARRPTEIPERAQTQATRHHHPLRDRREQAGLPADPRATAAKRHLGVFQRRREHRAAHNNARPISARDRRILVRWLRLTAKHATDRDPIRRSRGVLLHYRAAAVRTDLLEIAALLDHAPNPDPDCIAALRDLLANGCDSPLYNADIHFSQLQATLDYVRCGL